MAATFGLIFGGGGERVFGLIFDEESPGEATAAVAGMAAVVHGAIGGVVVVIGDELDARYPLAGLQQLRPLTGQRQTYPLG